MRNCVVRPPAAMVTRVNVMQSTSSRGHFARMSSPTAMMAMLGGKKNSARWFRKNPETPEICSGLSTLRQRRMSSRTMPMMFPGRGTPTIRCRNSPARQMAKMMASCDGILISAGNVEIIFLIFTLNGNCKFF